LQHFIKNPISATSSPILEQSTDMTLLLALAGSLAAIAIVAATHRFDPF